MKIEQLKSEVSDITTSLNNLKDNVKLPEEEKKKQAEALKTKVEETKKKINDRISELSEKSDKNSKKEVEEGKQLLETLESVIELQGEIIKGENAEDKKGYGENKGEESGKGEGKGKEKKEEGEEQTEQESKNIFGKTREWTKEQWNDVRDKEKWKEEGLKNTLRTAGFIATGVGAVALAYKGVKKIRNRAFGDKEEDKQEDDKVSESKSKKKKKKEESSRWKKFLVGAGLAAGTVVGGVEVYKHRNRISSRFKEKLGLALSFDEAIQKVEAEVRNGKVDDDHFGVFNAHFEGGIKYDENTKEICSYGQKTKIEKNGKKLQGMENVEFASWEELIHAANIVNFAKRMLRGRGDSATPFCQTSWGGDIAFNCSAKGKQEFLSASNSNEWSWILGTLGTVGGGILGGYCAGVHGAAIGVVGGGTGGYALGAYIDNSSTAGRCCETISRGKNFDEFINYLNRQTDENGKSLWESAGEQHLDPNETPINPVVDNGKEGSEWKGVLEEIENTYGEDQTGRRNLQIERDPSKPTEYKIKSYSHELKMIVEGLPTKNGEKIDYSKIKKIHIEKYEEYDCRGDGLDIDFPHTEEGLKEAIKTANLTNMIVEDRKGKGGQAYPFFWGKYTTPKSLDMDVEGFRGKTILSRNGAKKFPTLFEDLKKGSDGGFGSIIGFTNGHQENMHNQAVQDQSEGSQYIKFLHQIGKGHFWKKQ